MKNNFKIITIALLVMVLQEFGQASSNLGSSSQEIQKHETGSIDGLDLNKQDVFGSTLLHEAINHPDGISKVKFLIAQSANLNIKNNRGRTPLDQARCNAMNTSVYASGNAYLDFRKKDYEICAILEQAGAQSSVTLEPMPSDEIMLQQKRLSDMEAERDMYDWHNHL